jgi:hypothetical protein
MKSRGGESIAIACAIVMGLGVSTGYPLGMIAAAGMPVAVLAPGSRKSAFNSALGYYLAALWPIIPGLDRYIGRSATVAAPIALWVLAAVLLSLPWSIVAMSDRLQYLWRSPLALLATVIPPLGIIGLASPLIGAGYLFPGTAWAGLALVAFLPGIVLAVQALPILPRYFLLSLVFGFCIGFALDCWHFHSGEVRVPRGWAAVNTHFGDLSKPFQDYLAARFIRQRAEESSARVLIFPEAVVPRWSEATEVFWRRSLDRWRTRGQIIVLGAGLPLKTRQNAQNDMNDLRLYDFRAAINALNTMHASSPLRTARPKPRPETTDNAMLVLGAESATYYQRIPVPVGMWRPFSQSSVPLRLTAPGVLEIDHQRAAVLICYEQLLTFPILTSMLQHPTVIVGISNTFWVRDTSIPRFQANAVRAWAKLFRLPYLLAVNS